MRLALFPTPDPIEPARPTLVLLHGLTGSHRTWWRFVPALADAGWQVLAMDLRCHGASGCDEPIGRRDLADDVLETLVAAVGRPHADVLWGHSLGGRTALQLLAGDPGVADRAIIEDPPGLRGDRSDHIATWRREGDLARTDPAAFAAEVRGANPGWDERDVAAVVADVADTRIEPLIAALRAGQAMLDPSEELMGRVSTPVLLVLAAEDRSGLSGESRVRALERLPAGSQHLVLDSGHTVHRDQPGAYLAAALRWLG
jgi:pimeloyl-ACP methyl ester carboxylesterase